MKESCINAFTSKKERPFAHFGILICSIFLISPLAHGAGCDGAGNCYVRPGANGSGTGTDWINAYTGFGTAAGQVDPSTMTRGVTYWIASGTFGAPKFDTPDAGTSTITIEAATTANHGPASDWNNAFAGIAKFSGGTITTDYWTINGQKWPCTGTVLACGTSGYNIYIDNTTNGSQAFSLAGGTAAKPQTNITMKYFELSGIQNGSSEDGGLNVGCANNNVDIGYAYIHDVGVDLVQAQYTCSGQNYTGVGWLFEHDFFAHNHRGDPSAHAQAIATGAQNLWVRYSIFHDIGSSGGITDPFPGDVTLKNWAIYGNVFEWDNNFTAGVGDGLVGLFGETMNGYFYVVNNTLAYINNSSCVEGICNSPALYLCGSSCGSGGSPSPAIVENNLWWNPSNGQGYMLASSSSWTPIGAYNEAYCPSGGCSYPGAGGFTEQGTSDLQSNTGNPFVHFDGSSNFNVGLIANTSAGISIPGAHTAPSGCTAGVDCLDIDGYGTTRAVNGTWDRGALQINGAPVTLQSITVTPAKGSIPVNETQQFTATGTYSNGSTSNLTSTVTWSSSSSYVASMGSSGMTTAVAVGSVTIKAVSGSVIGTTTLTVTAPVLQSIVVTPASSSLTAGKTLQYTATGTYNNGTTQNLTSSATWSSSNTTAASISATGLASGVAVGTATIKAASGSISGSTGLNVIAPVTLTSIAISPVSFSLAVGATRQLTVTGTYSNGTTQNLSSAVTWSSSKTADTTVSSSGLVTGVASGSATIKSVLGSLSVSATATVTASTLPNPLAWWMFNQGSGDTAVDSTGNGATGYLYSGATWEAGASGGFAVDSPGSSGYVKTDATKMSAKAVTWTGWVKRTYKASGQGVLIESSPNFNNSETGFGLFPDDSDDCGIANTMMTGVRGNVGYTLNCYAQPTSGVWHHFAAVYDKSQSGTKVISLYIDGVLQTPVLQWYTATNTNSFAANNVFLFSRGGISNYLAAGIEDLRIYNSALTAAQIKQIYQLGAEQ